MCVSCHLAFKRPNQPNLHLFWNCLPEMKCFALFWHLQKIAHFKECYGQIWAKLTIFYKIPKFVFLLANFLEKIGLYLASFIFEGLAFLKLLMTKFGLINFFGPGNPDLEFLAWQCPLDEINHSPIDLSFYVSSSESADKTELFY